MTKLRFVIADKDEKYIGRLAEFIGLHHSDKIEIYSFTREDMLNEFIQKNKVNGVFVGACFEKIAEEIQANTAFAYFTEGIETEGHGEVHTLMKYQSADAIVKEMLALCSEQISHLYSVNKSSAAARIYLFESPMGGVGTTTAACACAYYMYRQGRRPLYLNLESFGSLEGLFSGEGKYDFGDVIYALKVQKGNLNLRLESIVKEDRLGVFYIEPCKYAADLKSLTTDEMRMLLEILRDGEGYDCVIIDKNSGLDENDNLLREYADAVIVVSDGRKISEQKIEKFFDLLEIQEKNTDILLRPKIKLFYNKCHTNIEQKGTYGETEILGSFPRHEQMEGRKLLEQMAAKAVFDRL